MFSYIGGKSQIGKWIKDFIPKDTENYLEPFSGAFWVYFNMELSNYPNLKRVIYNDINKVNCNLFNCLKQPETFYNFLKKEEVQKKDPLKYGESSPNYLKEKFEEYQKRAFNNNHTFDLGNPNYGWATEYAFVITQVFSGVKPETSTYIDLKHKYRSKFDTFRDKVGGIGRNKKYPEYLRNITDIRNDDFQKVIENFDNEKTFIYLDPPYFKTEDYYSNQSFNLDDHKRLAKTLQNTRSRWALSYYYFDLLEEWFPKDKFRWETKQFNKASNAKKGEKQSKAEEILILNF